MGVRYTVNIINNSTQAGSVCIYQTDPDLTDAKAMSLAWLSKTMPPNSRLKLNWKLDYSFVWGVTGVIEPGGTHGDQKHGVVFDAAQAIPADLTTINQITFSKFRDTFMFSEQKAGPRAGSLYVQQDDTVPANAAEVGIGMDGAGTFIVPSQPNMQLIFTPHPKYWITFGDYIAGQVLDISSITQAAALEFPPSVFSLTATLNLDNRWTVTSTADMNMALVKARKSNADAVWGSVA